MSSSSSLCPACYECPAPTTAAGVWPEIEAITKDANKTAATITITYSFIQAGTLANDHSAGGAATCVEIKDYFDSSVTNANFKQEIIDAFQVWKDGFEEACPWLTLNFVNLGDEVGAAPDSDPYAANYTIGSGGTYPTVGDFRIGMHNIDGLNNTLAHAYAAGGTLGAVGNVGGDLHFDSSENWRLDSNYTSETNAISIKYVAVHEIGHNLGLGHSTHIGSVMYPSVGVSTSFENPPFNSELPCQDIRNIKCIYGIDQPNCSLSHSSSSQSSNASPSSSSQFSSSASPSPSASFENCCVATACWGLSSNYLSGGVVKVCGSLSSSSLSSSSLSSSPSASLKGCCTATACWGLSSNYLAGGVVKICDSLSSSSPTTATSSSSSGCCQATKIWGWGTEYPLGKVVKNKIPVIVGGTP